MTTNTKRSAWEWRKASGGFTIRTDPYPERLFHAYDVNDNAACDPSLGLAASSEQPTEDSKRCPQCLWIVVNEPDGRKPRTAPRVVKGKGADRRLVMDPPSSDYRQLGWHCIYHEQAVRMCHNPLDCDLVPTWALTVAAAKRIMSENA